MYDSYLTASKANRGLRFSLGSLLLLVTAFSVWMMLLVRVPVVAALVLFVLAPAWMRAWIAIRVDRLRGEVTTILEKIEHVLYSVLMVLVLYLLAFGIVFGSLLLTTVIYGVPKVLLGRPFPDLNWESELQLMGIALGSLAALLFTLGRFRQWWPRVNECGSHEFS